MKFEAFIQELLLEFDTYATKKPEVVDQGMRQVRAQLDDTTDADTRLQLGAQLALIYLPTIRASEPSHVSFESSLKNWLLLEDVDKNIPLEIYPGAERLTVLEEICRHAEELIPYALKQGCNPNIQVGNNAFTLLTWLIAHNKIHAASELLDRCKCRGIPLDLDMTTGFNQTTPLILALVKGNVRLIDDLLSQGADPNKADEQGFTPLHYAYMKRDIKIIELLTRHGATHDAKNQLGQTPWDMLLSDYSSCREKFEEIACSHYPQGACMFPESDEFKARQELCGKFSPEKVKRNTDSPGYAPKFVTPYSIFRPRFKLHDDVLKAQQAQYASEIDKDVKEKDFGQVFRDWDRPSTIHIAGECLKGDDGNEMLDHYFNDEEDLKGFFDTHLVQPLTGLTPEKQVALLAVCQSSLHQGGLLYPTRRVFLSSKTTEANYHVEVKQRVNITPVEAEGALYFHEVEQCRGWFLANDAEKSYFQLETVLKLTIGDDLQPKIKVVDFMVTMHNSISLPCCDERTLLDRLIDFLKSLFGMQTIDVNPDILKHEPARYQK